jgi:hypothetical protein
MQASAKTTTSVAEVTPRPMTDSTKGSSNSASAANDEVAAGGHGYSKRRMRSPNRPRGRSSSTSSISR